MRNLYSIICQEAKPSLLWLTVILLGAPVASASTVTFTNNTVVAIPDNSYDGSFGSMGSSSITVTGIPAGATINNIRVNL